MERPSDTLANRLQTLTVTIAEHARRSGRDPAEVRLIAISKTHPAPAIAAVMGAGQFEFGESTAQEALPKISQLQGRPITWHFVGHLQSNKARFIPGNFAWIHSLHSAQLARRLSQLALEKNTVLSALVEVNITRDPQKHGMMPEAVRPFLEQVLKENLSGLAVRGLMTIGPHPATEPQARHCFAQLRALREECREHFGLATFTELSMGMSDDFGAAIAEGATMLRLGTVIFGERNYSKK